MWTCDQCGEVHEDQFQSCWKCAGIAAAAAGVDEGLGRNGAPPPRCLRCQTDLDFIGTRIEDQPPLLESNWASAIFGMGRTVEIFACPSCRRMEFFLTGHDNPSAN